MKKIAHIFLFCFLASCFLSLASNLSAQSGWSEDMRLTFDYAYSADPKAACDGDTIHLVWWKNYLDSLSNYRDEVFYKRSTDAGETWGDDVLLSIEDATNSTFPIVGCVGLKVYIFWLERNFGTLFRKSTDGGTTWSTIDSSLIGAGYHDIFILNDTIFLAGGRNPGDIIFRKSTDGGNTWLPLQVIGYGCYEQQAVDVPFIGFVYQVTRFSQEIMFKRSTDNGTTWLDSVLISHFDSTGSQWAVIDVDTCSNMHTTWYDYKYSPYAWTGDIFYRTSRDSGNTWEEIDSLTVMHRATASDILAEGDNLHLVWEDDRHGFDWNREIYYRMSTDLGETWESEVRLTNASFHSRRPSLACDGDFLHLFWSDQRDSGNTGPWMLYYKRKDLVGINEEMIVKPYSVGIILNCPTLITRNSLIYYDLGKNKEGEIVIIDVTGRVIETFPVHQVSGYFVFGSNKEVCEGIYFIMLRAGEDYTTRKVLVVK